MKVSIKDLHLSCSEDMGPLNNLNILSFQDNREDLVRSFHSLPNPPYNLPPMDTTQAYTGSGHTLTTPPKGRPS